jgi:POT family proton-dependent oligopeptide transporter
VETPSAASHPEGLWYLFFAEAWERFSFYGMRALLVLYMTQAFAYDDARAYEIYGAYTALVYATPVIGGLVADRLLGFRKAVLLGGVLMAFGHFAMAIEGAFYLALGLLIAGNGFFKPNVSTIVGRLYGPDDPRRDAGFTIFYMGINAGAALAPIVCGYLRHYLGWHFGFGAAGVGMLIGLAVFMKGRGAFGDVAEPPDPALLRKPLSFGLNREILVYAGAIVEAALAWQLVQQAVWVGRLLIATAVISLFGLLLYLFLGVDDRKARDRMGIALVLIVISMVFWSFFEQAGSSMNLFAERNVDRRVLGTTLPTEIFQAVNPVFILIFGLVFGWLWVWLARRSLEPSIPLKFGFGIVQLGLGFGALYIGAVVSGSDGMVGMGWLVLGYLLHTTGELCVSPIGLSMITKLSPPKVVGVMMGAWFLSSAFAQYVASLIAALTGVSGGAEGGTTLPPASETVMVYGSVFGGICIVALLVGVAVCALSPLLARGTHGVR